jgi:hypothetical protein
MTASKWTLQDVMPLIRAIENVCPSCGCHVALTGGLLYKDGERKDADILFYRIRQIDKLDKEALLGAMEGLGVVWGKDYGWCHKATYNGRDIDFFFPEVAEGDYPDKEEVDVDFLRDLRSEEVT